MLEVGNERLPTDAAEPWLLTPQEAAQKLRISRSKIYELISKGDIQAVHIGRCRRIDAAHLREWLQKRSSGSK